MITCPACQHENVDGTQFCEMCGEELPQTTSAAPASENMVSCPECGHENSADNLICEACGAELQHSNAAASPAAPAAASIPTPAPDVDFAPGIGAFEGEEAAPATSPAPASDSSTTPFDDLAASAPASDSASDSAPAPSQNLTPGSVKLVVEQGQTVGAQFVLGDEEMLVGREDEDEEIYPDIDLSDQDAGYVHRRHATLKFEGGTLSVTHLGGANKTRLNNKPLADNEPTPIKPGDKIGFGKVVVRLLPV